MDSPGTNSKGNQQHMRHCPIRYPVEFGGGTVLHSPPLQPVDVKRPSRVQVWKRDGDSYNGVKDRPGDR